MTYPLSRIASLLLLPLLLCAAMAGTGCSRHADRGIDDEMLARLDSALAVKETTFSRKQSQLDALRHSLAGASDARRRYDLYRTLYSRYYTFNFDSAARYAALMSQEVLRLGDDRLYRLSLIDEARVNMLTGNYSRATAALAAARVDTTDHEMALAYYNAMADRAERNNEDAAVWYTLRDPLLSPGSADFIYNRVNSLQSAGRYDEALDLFAANRRLFDGDPHHRGICNYMEARLHLLKGDTVAAINNLAESAYNDLITPVRDYKSLFELAQLLMRRGDTDHAYRYIRAAVDDGRDAHVVSNAMAVNAMLPEILHQRDSQDQERKHMQNAVGVVIAVLALLLALLLYFVQRARNRADRANAELNSANAALNRLNGELQASNTVKDAYLIQYFNLCSHFVGVFDEFRTNVSNTLHTKGATGIEKLLARTDGDRELKRFYTNFDETFLKLFPDFVEKFNDLLRPECRVSLNRDGSMPNELRTFALIRLGITDSGQIATFLRRSLSTVYNYRVRLRNGALGDRDAFEAAVAAI